MAIDPHLEYTKARAAGASLEQANAVKMAAFVARDRERASARSDELLRQRSANRMTNAERDARWHREVRRDTLQMAQAKAEDEWASLAQREEDVFHERQHRDEMQYRASEKGFQWRAFLESHAELPLAQLRDAVRTFARDKWWPRTATKFDYFAQPEYLIDALSRMSVEDDSGRVYLLVEVMEELARERTTELQSGRAG